LYLFAGVSSFLKCDAPEHSFGNKAASIPRMQIDPKIEPTTGFRQRRSSSATGGLNASILTRNNPKSETLIRNDGYRSSFTF